jgi:DNA polymerase-3 subunit beta
VKLKGGLKIEQLNIEGKRSGSGFIAHKAVLVNALSRALADRVVLMDVTLGCKGLLGYLKALGGSNVVKVVPSTSSGQVPSTDSASESQANGHKRLKVICGSNTSYLSDSEWIGEKTPLTFCEVRISPKNSVKPNIGSGELAETLSRVLPFTTSDDARPVLQCVNLVAKDGKLTMVSADGFRLAITSLDYDNGEGQVLISRDNLKGVVNALKRAKRARVSFENGGDSLDAINLVIDTELIRYRWQGLSGDYPDYEKLIPTEFNTAAHFDTVEAIKTVNSLKALSGGKEYPIDLTIGDGKVVMANPDDKGETELPADTDGEVKVRIDGQYLAEALRACGGMVDLKLVNGYSPMLFSSNGYSLVVMPMMTDESNRQAEADKKARLEKMEAEQPAETAENTEQADSQTEPEAKTKPKKRSRKREAVAVA